MTSHVLSFTVHAPPVPKARARVMRGFAFTPARTKAYEQLVKATAIEALAQLGTWTRDNAKGYSVRIAVYRARRAGDLDNFVKSATDAINGLAFDDDKRIVELRGLMFDDKADPRMLIEVEAIQ